MPKGAKKKRQGDGLGECRTRDHTRLVSNRKKEGQNGESGEGSNKHHTTPRARKQVTDKQKEKRGRISRAK